MTRGPAGYTERIGISGHLMSATRKKVVVRLRNGTLHQGYLPDGGFAAPLTLDLLLLDGKAIAVPLGEVLHVAYVRNFNLDDLVDPERIGFRSFPSKPRAGGLWVRVHFSAGDTLEGVIHEGGMAFLDALLRDRGVFMEPPNPRGNTQRLFIPRSAMEQFEILSVPGNTSAAKRRADAVAQRQGGLFDLN